MEKALVSISSDERVAEIFIIGGSSLYNMCISSNLKEYCKLVIGTRINKKYECDTFLTEIENCI